VRVTLRRAPRYAPFALTGAIVGLLIGGAFAILGPDTTTTDFSGTTALGYLGAIGVLLGGIVGAGVAVLVDRRR
jgi:predicted membrane protein